MKQEILCPECIETMKKIREKIKNHPEYNEGVKIKEGKAKAEMFICDLCGSEIEKGEKCYAVSMWKTVGSKLSLIGINPYYEWEDEYIEVEKEI